MLTMKHSHPVYFARISKRALITGCGNNRNLGIYKITNNKHRSSSTPSVTAYKPSSRIACDTWWLGSEGSFPGNALSAQLEALLTGHTATLTCIRVGSKFLVSGGEDGKVIVWDRFKPTLLRCFEPHNGKKILCISSSQEKILSGSEDNTICVTDFSTGNPIRSWQAHTNFISGIQFSHNLVISCGFDEYIKIWDLREKNSLVQSWKGHFGPVSCLQFDAFKLITGSYDGFLKLWDLRKQISHPEQCLHTFNHSQTCPSRPSERKGTSLACPIYCAHFDAQHLAIGCQSGFIQIYDSWWNASHLKPSLSRGNVLGKNEDIVLKLHEDVVTSVQLHGNYLVTSSLDCNVKLISFDYE